LQSLSFQLPSEISKFILATPRPLILDQADCIYWNAAKNGQFNSSSAYRLAFEQTTPPPPPGYWKWIWKVNTIPQVVFFLWLASHDRLPTKTLLYNRKILTEDICPLCKSDSESTLHIFRDCSVVKPLWLTVGASPEFFSSSNIFSWVKTWISSDLPTSFHQSLRWKDVFHIFCWSLWYARNKVVMEGFIFQPIEVMKKAKSLAIDFFYSLPHKNDKTPKVETLIGWTPPPTGFVKLNTNGSVLRNSGHASSGGLRRDNNGNWIQGFSHFLGITNSLVAELWGLWDGLTLARDLHISRLVVELDAKAVIDLLKPVSRTPFVTHPYSALIDDCRCLLQTFERVVI
jgi:hypothetical protein